MLESWTVLGGWGVEPEALRPVFGGQSTYIDINRLIPSIVENGELRPDWRERCGAAIEPYLRGGKRLAGWSTGAIIALACRDLVQPDALVLISATLSFCRSSLYPYGMRPSLLETMRRKLSSDAPAVLRDFRTRCGFPDDSAIVGRWSSEELADGLRALERMMPAPAGRLAPPPLIIHGRADAIIPFAAGEAVHRITGGFFTALDAPHACFVNNEETIRRAIEHYLKELDHEPV